jgi:hypothetical protein
MYNNKVDAVRAAAILTNAYVAGTVIENAQNFNELVLYCAYTKGSLTSVEVKVESSMDGTTYCQETNVTASSGTLTVNKANYTTTEDGNFKIYLPISANFIRVSANGTGTVTGSSLAITSMLHTV